MDRQTTTTVPLEAELALERFEDETIGLPLFVNAGLPLNDATLERMFDQDGG